MAGRSGPGAGKGRIVRIALAIAVLMAAGVEAEQPAENGTIEFVPPATEQQTAEPFRLPPHRFDWQARRMQTVTENLEVWDVTFPSPIKTAEESNNTVHGEYYRSRQSGRRPAVVVLHILGGDFPLSRLFCNALGARRACRSSSKCLITDLVAIPIRRGEWSAPIRANGLGNDAGSARHPPCDGLAGRPA